MASEARHPGYFSSRSHQILISAIRTRILQLKSPTPLTSIYSPSMQTTSFMEQARLSVWVSSRYHHRKSYILASKSTRSIIKGVIMRCKDNLTVPRSTLETLLNAEDRSRWSLLRSHCPSELAVTLQISPPRPHMIEHMLSTRAKIPR